MKEMPASTNERPEQSTVSQSEAWIPGALYNDSFIMEGLDADTEIMQ